MKRDTALEKMLLDDMQYTNREIVRKEAASLGMALGSDLADWEEWREKNAKEMLEEFRASLNIEALMIALLDKRWNDARNMALEFIETKAKEIVESNEAEGNYVYPSDYL